MGVSKASETLLTYFLYYMKIIGLDVGRGSAVLCCLDSFPQNIQQHYRQLARSHSFFLVKCDRAGVDKLLSLQPDGIVIEPTGYWYSHFWLTVARKNNLKVYWIGHTDLDKQRGSYGFVNKRDEEDALCLAASYFDDRFVDSHGNKRFLNYYYDRDKELAEIRETFLEKEQLQKLRSGLIAQLRQRLAYEYPEAVNHWLNISQVRGFTPIIGWLASLHQDARYDNKYKLSVAHELGINISDYTRDHARTIVNIEHRITNNRQYLTNLLEIEHFKPYFAVFERFGFGLDNKILLLYHCYPFEKFLLNGKPWVEREFGLNNKLQKRDRFLRKFQAYLGLSYSYRSSGDQNSKKFYGSSLVRAHLYAWAVCMVAPKNHRIKTDIGQNLSQRYDELRMTVKGKDALIRILFKATRMLYKELCRELIL